MFNSLKESWEYYKRLYKLTIWDLWAILATIAIITALALLYW